MYAQTAVKPNILSRNGAYGIVMRDVQKCTCAGASLRGKNSATLCCIIYMTATDAPYIYGAFLTQYGIDLNEIEYLHWWKFQSLFKSLILQQDCGNHVLQGTGFGRNRERKRAEQDCPAAKNLCAPAKLHTRRKDCHGWSRIWRNGMIPQIPIERTWARCTHCGAKAILFDNTAVCHGVFLKCTRGCGREFELVIRNGKQITEKH